MAYAFIVVLFIAVMLGIICIRLAKVCVLNEAEITLLREGRITARRLISLLEADKKHLHDTLERIKDAHKPTP